MQPPFPCFDRVRTAALTLPGVEESTKYDGSPVLQVGGVFLAGLAMHPSTEPETLVVRAEPADREAMLADDAETYYVTGYYRKHPVVLVRLARIDSAALQALLLISWRMAKAKAGGGARKKPGYGC